MIPNVIAFDRKEIRCETGENIYEKVREEIVGLHEVLKPYASKNYTMNFKSEVFEKSNRAIVQYRVTDNTKISYAPSPGVIILFGLLLIIITSAIFGWGWE